MTESIEQMIKNSMKESREALKNKNVYLAERRLEDALDAAVITGRKISSSLYKLRREVCAFSSERYMEAGKKFIEKGDYDSAIIFLNISENRAKIGKVTHENVEGLKKTAYEGSVEKHIGFAKDYLAKNDSEKAMIGLSFAREAALEGNVKLPEYFEDLVKEAGNYS
jgi:hypothetical protein